MQDAHMFVLWFLLSPIQAEVCEADIDHLLLKGHALDGHRLWETKSKDAIECARLCIRRGKACESFNFNGESKQCQLNSKSGQPSATNTSVVYSNIDVWPSQVDPDCYNHPCGDDEVCIPGGLTGGTSCSYSCFKYVQRCPVPEGTVSSEPRTIGSIYTHTCDPGLVGGDSAVCLPTGQWNKTIDLSCEPRIGASCENNDLCAPINGTCTDNVCVCNDGLVYDASEIACVRDCGPLWFRFRDKCYLLSVDFLTYEDSKGFCSSVGSQLVIAETMEENEFLKTKMREESVYYTSYWNGLMKANATTFHDWAEGEPNGANSETCIAFSIIESFKWNDVPCHVAFLPVCEK